MINLTFNYSYSQGNYKTIMAETIKKYDYSKINKLAKDSGYSNGDIIKTSVSFKVNHKGETFDIKATGPKDFFIKESEKIVSSLPKMDFGVPLKKGQHFMFELPITYNITD